MLSGTLAKTTILTTILLSSHTVFSQLDTSALSAKLTSSKEKLGKDVAFILYKDGKIAYKKEIGRPTLKTPVPIAASSQWLTAALVMTFVQEGKLSLDDKVSTYLPIFTKYYKNYITIRHCLTNSTGIKSEQGIAKLLQKNKFRSLEEEVDEYASKRDIETNAGTEFRYSNVGFNIAGRVLEIISRKSFDRLMQDRILRPLAMKNTTFTNENYNDAVNPATGAKSSVGDFINFLTMILDKGSFNNKQVLTENSVTMLHTLSVEATEIKWAPTIDAGLSYGMGEWILERNAEGKPVSVGVPSLFGMWPMIDLCRHYACVILGGETSGETTRHVYLDIKTTIDNMMGGSCR
jgi:CubicO group peptidase (beta-lactamase class C family)